MMQPDDDQELKQAIELVAHRQVFARRPQTVGRWIGRVVARRGISSGQAQAELQQAWREICDPILINQTQVLSIRHRKLQVRVGNSLINQQLHFDRARLLQELQTRFPHLSLQGLVFQTGSIDCRDTDSGP